SYTGAVTAGNGYALLDQDTGRSRAAIEAAVVASGSAYAGTFAVTPGTNWTAVVATFRGRGGTTTTLPSGTTTTSSTVTSTTRAPITTTSTTTAITTTSLAPASGADAGHVHVFKAATSSFNPYTANPTPAEEQWMRDHYWRMLAYSPYFDTRTAWYPDAWVYE